MESVKRIAAEGEHETASVNHNKTRSEDDLVQDLVKDLVKLNIYGDAKTLEEIIEGSEKNVDDTRTCVEQLKGSFKREAYKSMISVIL